MAKRKEDSPPPGSPAWMATFGDLMNLLLCFFVMMFAMSDVNAEKLKAVAESMNQTFSIWSAGATAIGEGILVSNGVSQLNELDEYINSTGRTADSSDDSEQYNEYDKMAALVEEAQLAQSEELAERIREAVEEGNMQNEIEVEFTSEYVQLTLKGAILFDPGKVELKKDAVPIVDKVGVILERYAQGLIEIEGHTDNVPMNSAKYANNNELSSARALSVFDYLMETTTLEPSHVKYSGRGEYVPVADNSTEEGRAKNRRVEIRIYHSDTLK